MRHASHTGPSMLRSAFDAALIMAIGMGFGRFAFTAIYPHMVDEGILSLQQGSVAASANYAGYLLGAVLGMRAKAATSHRLCLAAVAGTVFCLAILAVLQSTWAIIAVRGAAGVFNALTMVAASQWLLQQRQHPQGAPLLYGGVGLGIALSAEVLVAGTHFGLNSPGLWLLLAAASLAIGLVCLPSMWAATSGAKAATGSTASPTTGSTSVTPASPTTASPTTASPTTASPTTASPTTGSTSVTPAQAVSAPASTGSTPPHLAARPTAPSTANVALVKPWPLAIAYGLAGLGYIVTATYLPLLVKTALPDLESAHVWAVFGLGAAPSCYLWYWLHQRLGTRKALALNLAVQAVGVALPIFVSSAAGYLVSALLVGGTFTGTVTIAMPAAQRLAGKVRGNLMATMTFAYGIGQIAGPVMANALYAQSQAFATSLAAAASALVVAALLSLFAL